ncbi:hypothetical protein MKX03_007724 [Papaver bracteatum]|nr:hypothetical protein MKX03_007724 [Papaver bracteatum]
MATVGFIEEESSQVKKYATFDFTVEKKEDEVTTSEDFSSDEEELKERPEVVSKSVSVGATDRSSGSSIENEMEVVITARLPETASRNGSIDVLEKEIVSSENSGSAHSSSDEDNVTVDNDAEMVDAELPKTNSCECLFTFLHFYGIYPNATELKFVLHFFLQPETSTTTQIQKTESKKLFVGDLSFSLEQEDLEEFFKDAGQIVNVQFATHGDGRFKGHAIVEFATEESVQKALERNGQNLMGKSVKLSLPGKTGGAGSSWKSDVDAKSPKTSKPKTPTTPQNQNTGSKKLFVGNLSFSLEQKDLEEFFKDAGEIVKVDFATLKNGRSKGHAIVTFAAEEAVQKAFEKNGQNLMGRPVHIGSPSTPQTGHARGGRSGSHGGHRGVGRRRS